MIHCAVSTFVAGVKTDASFFFTKKCLYICLSNFYLIIIFKKSYVNIYKGETLIDDLKNLFFLRAPFKYSWKVKNYLWILCSYRFVFIWSCEIEDFQRGKIMPSKLAFIVMDSFFFLKMKCCVRIRILVLILGKFEGIFLDCLKGRNFRVEVFKMSWDIIFL